MNSIARGWFPTTTLAFRFRIIDTLPFLVYLVYFFVGLHVITGGGFYGQDFVLHGEKTKQLISNPQSLFAFDSTNPPLLYLIGAFSLRIFGAAGHAYAKASSVVLLVINTISLHLCYLIARRICQSRLIAILGISFLALLPFTVLTSVIYASDALTLLPFFGFIYFMIRIVEEPDHKRAFSIVAGLFLCLASLSKYTFIVFVPVSAIFLLLIWQHKCPTYRPNRLLVLFISTVFIPGLILSMVRVKNSHYTLHDIGFSNWGRSMSVRSLLLPRVGDLDLLAAPSFWETSYWGSITQNGVQGEINNRVGYKLLVENRYSYPGLLHLAIYTDLMNIADRGLADGLGLNRPKWNQFLQGLSCILGAPFSILMVGFVFYAVFHSLFYLTKVSRGSSDERQRLLFLGFLLIPTLAFFSVIVILFPFMRDVYFPGYWLPRLVFPSILGFGLISLYSCDKILTALSAHFPLLCTASQFILAFLVILSNMVHVFLLWR